MLATRSENEITSLLANIRYALISSADLINIVNPTGLINLETYAKALEYNCDKSKYDVTQKMYLDRYNTQFYVGNNNVDHFGFRKITPDDFKSQEFVKKLISFIKLYGGLRAHCDMAHIDNKIINIENFNLCIDGYTAYMPLLTNIKKNDICQLVNTFGHAIVKSSHITISNSIGTSSYTIYVI